MTPSPSSRHVTLIDYDAGNHQSVVRALEYLGARAEVTRDPEVLRGADRIIFPGVGAARATMDALETSGLGEALREVVASGRPTLGICIACQVIFSQSEEDASGPDDLTRCLGLLEGRVERFVFPPGVQRKIPQIGWNEVHFRPGPGGREHPVFARIPAGSQFYFVHGYHVRPRDPSCVAGTARYGEVDFTAAVSHENLVATQFHAEKSGPAGLTLLESFLDWSP